MRLAEQMEAEGVASGEPVVAVGSDRLMPVPRDRLWSRAEHGRPEGPRLRATPTLSVRAARPRPVANVFVGLAGGRAGSTRGGSAASCGAAAVDGELESLCYAGANLVPVGAGPDALRAFAERARRQGRRCSSIVGPAAMVLRAVAAARARLGTGARRPPAPAADGDRRPPAGRSPTRACGRVRRRRARRAAAGLHRDVHRGGRRLAARRRRRTALPRPGRRARRHAAARSPASRTAGSCSRPRSARSTADACQVQGVWVAPDRRGRGAGRARHGGRRGARAGASIAPVVSSTSTTSTSPRAALPAGRLHRGRHLHVRPLLGEADSASRPSS